MSSVSAQLYHQGRDEEGPDLPDCPHCHPPCDVCGRPTPHLAHASSRDGQVPADPPFERTLADDLAKRNEVRGCPSKNCSGKFSQCVWGKCPHASA